MSRVSILLVLLLLGCTMTVPPSSQPSEGAEPRDLPRVTVPLLGSTRDVRGMDLPEALHAERVGSADLLRPHLLTVRLSNGRELILAARSVSLISRNGIVESVYARRPMRPVRFKDAVADLRQTLKALKIEPDRRMAEQMAGWPVDAPGMDEEGAYAVFKTAHHLALEGIGGVDIRVSPDPDGGWYYLIIFGTSAEASKAAHEAAKAAGPQPPTPGPPAPTVVPSPDFPRVTVRLGGAVRAAHGVEIPATWPGGSASTAEVAQPQSLTIELPGASRPLFLLVRSSSFLSRDGLVDRISIRRPMLPLPYERAVADLLGTVKALGLDPEKIGARLKAQSKDPKAHTVSAEFPDTIDGIDLSVKVEPGSGDVWSYSLEFALKKK